MSSNRNSIIRSNHFFFIIKTLIQFVCIGGLAAAIPHFACGSIGRGFSLVYFPNDLSLDFVLQRNWKIDDVQEHCDYNTWNRWKYHGNVRVVTQHYYWRWLKMNPVLNKAFSGCLEQQSYFIIISQIIGVRAQICRGGEADKNLPDWNRKWRYFLQRKLTYNS